MKGQAEAAFILTDTALALAVDCEIASNCGSGSISVQGGSVWRGGVPFSGITRHVPFPRPSFLTSAGLIVERIEAKPAKTVA